MLRFPLLAAGLALALSAPASSADAPVLTIYTYDSFVSDWGPGPKVKAAFEEICACDLQFVSAGDGAALLARLQLEGKHTKADVVLGLDTNLTDKAAATGLFANHNGIPENLDLPVKWADPIFLPYDWGYFAFVYNRTDVSDPPDSFEALIATPDDFKVVIQDPRSSTPGLGLLLWVETAYGDRAPEIWEGLSPHILTVTKGWSEAYGMFVAGEADMVLSYTTSPAYHIIAEDDPSYAAAPFDEGHYMQIEVAAKIAGTDQPELADDFLAFMTSEAFQSIIPTTNWMYPAVMPPDGLPDGFHRIVTPEKSLLLPAQHAASVRDAALQGWLTALSK